MMAPVGDPPAAIPRDDARRIRLVILDVDGVMTDGGIYLGATSSGERVELKRFEIQDGIGTRLLHEGGIRVAIVTGRESRAVAMRAEELMIREVHQDRTASKLRIVTAMLERLGIGWEETAFLGDDLPDLPVMRRVGLPAAVGNAAGDVRAVARWQGTRHGGYGAVREFAEALLVARGQWSALVEAYVRQREAGL
ncbi:MAG TPA: HAD hydrolase family protein [Longimicrobium sp.]|jgi:3-deoxy-D-manno-octulosonate 8-phosphate phosphatase (KDO 8-P phosphatase)